MPGTHLHRLTISRRALVGVLLIGLISTACGSATTSPGPVASGSGAPGTTAPSASSSPATVAPAIVEALTDPSPTRASRAGRALDDAVAEAIGVRAAFGAETTDWLAELRSKVAKDVLDAAKVDYSGVVPTALSKRTLASATGPTTAFGEVWIGVTIMAPMMLQGMTRQIGQIVNSTGQPFTSHDERTEGTVGTTADTTIQFKTEISGSTVIVDGDASQVSIRTDTVTGQQLNKATYRAHIRAELHACPDVNGVALLKVQLDISGDMDAQTAFEGHMTGQQEGQVGDDAYLQTERQQMDMTYTATNGGVRTTGSGRRNLTIGRLPNGRGFDRVIDAQGTLDQGTMSEAESIRWQNVLQLTTMLATNQAFEAAEQQWRTGKCVRIDASEKDQTVDPDELVHFTAKPVHQIEANDLDKPIVATFTGKRSAIPMDQELDPVASMTYTASSTPGDQGTVEMKSTSNRGIGILKITFTVVPPLTLELEIDSKITVTKLSGYPTGGTVAKVLGRIHLEPIAGPEWHGEGTLVSATTTRSGACNVVKTTGQGVYDWVVRNAVVSPTTAAADVVVHMDNGTINESPDNWVLPLCRSTTLSGTLNTWENLFFTVHRKDYKANGFEVTGWTVTATPATWTSGGLIGEAHWSGTCDIDPIAAQVAGCDEKTTFRLYAVVGSPPPP